MIAYKAVKISAVDHQPVSLLAGIIPSELCTVYPVGEWTSAPVGNVFIHPTAAAARAEGGVLCEVWEVEVNEDEIEWLNNVPLPLWEKLSTLADYKAWWNGEYKSVNPHWSRSEPTMTAKKIKPIRRVSDAMTPWRWECGR